jgi:hypothetical protein
MEMDEEAVLSFLGNLCTQCLPAPKVFWKKTVPQTIYNRNGT